MTPITFAGYYDRDGTTYAAVKQGDRLFGFAGLSESPEELVANLTHFCRKTPMIGLGFIENPDTPQLREAL